MTRGKEDRPIRKESRKDALMALYQTCRDEERDLYNEICERAELISEAIDCTCISHNWGVACTPEKE